MAAGEGQQQTTRPDQYTQSGVGGMQLELVGSHEPLSTEAEESALLEVATKRQVHEGVLELEDLEHALVVTSNKHSVNSVISPNPLCNH
jgi:hypothetical protein